MKFITEMDLREQYKAEPFTAFKTGQGERLTPEARQFLLDRGVNLAEGSNETGKGCRTQAEEGSEAGEGIQTACKKKDWRMMKLCCKMRNAASLFLLSGKQLLNYDVLLAQKVTGLGKQFREIQKLLNHEGQMQIERLTCTECTGIKACDFSESIGDCFEVTEFHMQLEKGMEIAVLHHLRSTLHEIEPAVLEAFENRADKDWLCEMIIGNVNQIINSLCLMICLSVGGKTCQR